MTFWKPFCSKCFSPVHFVATSCNNTTMFFLPEFCQLAPILPGEYSLAPLTLLKQIHRQILRHQKCSIFDCFGELLELLFHRKNCLKKKPIIYFLFYLSTILFPRSFHSFPILLNNSCIWLNPFFLQLKNTPIAARSPTLTSVELLLFSLTGILSKLFSIVPTKNNDQLPFTWPS